MISSEVEQALIRFFDGIGLTDAAGLIRASSTDGGSSRWGDVGATFADEDEAAYVSLAREQAKRYCEAKAKHVRPVRQIDESNPSAVEGRKSALEWLSRKSRSVIRK